MSILRRGDIDSIPYVFLLSNLKSLPALCVIQNVCDVSCWGCFVLVIEFCPAGLVLWAN